MVHVWSYVENGSPSCVVNTIQYTFVLNVRTASDKGYWSDIIDTTNWQYVEAYVRIASERLY